MLDAAVRLEVNHWNGAVEPRVILREVYPLETAPDALSPHPCTCDDTEWWARFEAELSRDLTTQGKAVERKLPKERPKLHSNAGGSPRQVVEGFGSSPTATIAELVSSGAGVLAVAADASRRAALANGATGLARFNGGAALIACHRCGAGAVANLTSRANSGLALTDYAALAMSPDLASHFEHVVLVDSPASPADVARASAPVPPSQLPMEGGTAPEAPAGFLHPCSPPPSTPSRSAPSPARRPRARPSPASSARCARRPDVRGRPPRRPRRPRAASALTGDRGARVPRPA